MIVNNLVCLLLGEFVGLNTGAPAIVGTNRVMENSSAFNKPLGKQISCSSESQTNTLEPEREINSLDRPFALGRAKEPLPPSTGRAAQVGPLTSRPGSLSRLADDLLSLVVTCCRVQAAVRTCTA